ncbi:MAG TPA: MBL fold metallo-hydrolase [Geminicoccus sp.]|uniref:MBL fold metallo-hydrolase n=1 Tax=Geminicoccus sp. TaxID=2024832 RepID=UPI002CC150B8|nr:MBL fold metallo-hydrolase [Geminicoccus sp.]HWL70802.1 MBL fold metallo-hydrolase [Geminicoccus sp.]
MSVARTSRRGLLAGAGALAAASLPAGPAWAAAGSSQGDLQGAGFYRFRLGELTMTSVSDGVFHAEPAQPMLAPDAPPADFAAALRSRFLSPEAVDLQVNTLLVDDGRRKILIDTGAGAYLGPKLGRLTDNLRQAGVEPGEIDTVVISHAHEDHVMGVLDPDGQRVFPNADYVVGEAEWAYWTGRAAKDERGLADPSRRVPPIRRQLASMADRLRLVRPGYQVVPGMVAFAAFGHTPGQLTFMIESAGERLLYAADTAHHHVLGLRYPEWHVGFDQDPVLAVAIRRRTLDQAAIGRHLVLMPHFPFPGLGHIVRSGRRYAWIPVEWRW